MTTSNPSSPEVRARSSPLTGKNGGSQFLEDDSYYDEKLKRASRFLSNQQKQNQNQNQNQNHQQQNVNNNNNQNSKSKGKHSRNNHQNQNQNQNHQNNKKQGYSKTVFILLAISALFFIVVAYFSLSFVLKIAENQPISIELSSFETYRFFPDTFWFEAMQVVDQHGQLDTFVYTTEPPLVNSKFLRVDDDVTLNPNQLRTWSRFLNAGSQIHVHWNFTEPILFHVLQVHENNHNFLQTWLLMDAERTHSFQQRGPTNQNSFRIKESDEYIFVLENESIDEETKGRIVFELNMTMTDFSSAESFFEGSFRIRFRQQQRHHDGHLLFLFANPSSSQTYIATMELFPRYSVIYWMVGILFGWIFCVAIFVSVRRIRGVANLDPFSPQRTSQHHHHQQQQQNQQHQQQQQHHNSLPYYQKQHASPIPPGDLESNNIPKSQQHHHQSHHQTTIERAKVVMIEQSLLISILIGLVFILAFFLIRNKKEYDQQLSKIKDEQEENERKRESKKAEIKSLISDHLQSSSSPPNQSTLELQTKKSEIQNRENILSPETNQKQKEEIIENNNLSNSKSNRISSKSEIILKNKTTSSLFSEKNTNTTIPTTTTTAPTSPPLLVKTPSMFAFRTPTNSSIVENIVMDRSGEVLGGRTILKLDSYSKQSGMLSGAPNFRQCLSQDFPVFGVGQPTEFGVRTVANHLSYKNRSITTTSSINTNTNSSSTLPQIYWFNLREEPVVYINKRPFVLREVERPLANISILSGVSSERLEKMEERLRLDVLEESKKYFGNILIHDEESGDVFPCWEAANETTVQTPRQVMDQFVSEGLKLTFHRMPTTPEQPFKAPQFEIAVKGFIDHVHRLENASVVFNCQIGKGRSTLGMVTTVLLMVFANENRYQKFFIEKNSLIPIQPVDQDISSSSSSSPATARNSELRKKAQQYKPISDLVRILKDGASLKRIVDGAVDSCGFPVNLRDMIDKQLLRMEKSRSDSQKDGGYLGYAVLYLERYFNLIVFAAFLNDQRNELFVSQSTTKPSFVDWLNERPEITAILNEVYLDPRSAFEEAKSMLKMSGRTDTVLSWRTNAALSNNMILKSDLHSADHVWTNKLANAPNFRGSDKVYGVASCSFDGISKVVETVKNRAGNTSKQIVWLNLTEELTLFVNDTPWVLRDHTHPFRYYQPFSGISVQRLTDLENNLKKEFVQEANEFHGELLLHDETANAELVPVWERVRQNSICTPAEQFEKLSKVVAAADFVYHRIPVTPGAAPSFSTVDQLHQIFRTSIVSNPDSNFVISCQMGKGRSTMVMIMAYLFKNANNTISLNENNGTKHQDVLPKFEYLPILDLLRLIPNGQILRKQVDFAIELYSSTFNLREKMEALQDSANRTEVDIKIHNRKIVSTISRYLFLILYNSYIHSMENLLTPPTQTFDEYYRAHTEFKTIQDSLRAQPQTIFKLKPQNPTVIESRSGNVLTHGTLLKSDHFPGCQRKSMLPAINGAPNYRQISDTRCYGTAIPTSEGIVNVLKYLGCVGDQNAANNSSTTSLASAVWVSLREEPVVYINGRPFVLRKQGAPMNNIIYTGINYARVEQMELRLKSDVLDESRKYGGKILLHDEDSNGLTELWEPISDGSIMTPREVYSSLVEKGYRVKFFRVPITDEEAPEEDDFDDLVMTSKMAVSSQEDVRLIFNCQMGRGRTTTALIIGSLLSLWKDDTLLTLSSMPKRKNDQTTQSKSSEAIRFLNGDYQSILRLVRIVGVKVKSVLDALIDKCSHMQNLREDIYDRLLKSNDQALTEEARSRTLEVGILYLRRYFYLMSFTAYVLEQIPTDPQAFSTPFKKWMIEHPEIYSLLNNLQLN